VTTVVDVPRSPSRYGAATPSQAQILERVHAIAPLLEENAAYGEAAGRVAEESITTLTDVGAFVLREIPLHWCDRYDLGRLPVINENRACCHYRKLDPSDRWCRIGYFAARWLSG